MNRLTAREVRDLLIERKYNLAKHGDNPLATIHMVLKRIRNPKPRKERPSLASRIREILRESGEDC